MTCAIDKTVRRPKVLIFIGHYRPGYKAGGILRSIENLVNHLNSEFEFNIVTRDRDLTDQSPFKGIPLGVWTQVGFARVFYMSPEMQTLAGLRQIVSSSDPDVIYLNSYFESFSIKVLINRLLSRTRSCPVILSPRGEFAWASLKIRYPKKLVFMAAAKVVGLYRGVTWHASSEYEANDIRQVLGIDRSKIHIAMNLPIAVNAVGVTERTVLASPDQGAACRLVFLSRISPEKNLDYAIRVVAKVTAPITFDIIGPIDDAEYWKRCDQIRSQMPPGVVVNYLGALPPAEIMSVLGQYDLLLFPSGGENYGHVIAEALACGTPVLISTNTPWRGLEEKGLGWDIPLEEFERYVDVINAIAIETKDRRNIHRAEIVFRMRNILRDPAVLNANRALFLDRLSPE